MAKQDFEVAGRVIERDTLVIIPLYGVHRDNRFHPDSEQFNSLRPELARHSCTFMPFGDGPRHCIGRRFALQQIKLVISVLLSHYKFSPSPDTRYNVELAKNTVLFAPHKPIRLTIDHLRRASLSASETAEKLA
ncbi:cytochrome P450 3A15-like [Phlebotomus argentipes]|uniref:cytochrome P450 3A15-like n=1 Tax=Phlebotomus argentipes TaxID=94469 RepID=UPI0028932969|nr:cytochrome P450 3A15-like [Phlebotomus argentipes]